MSAEIRVLVWNEYIHERQHEHIARVYPKGIHRAISEHLQSQEGMVVETATLDQPEHGLQGEVLQVIVNAVRWAAPVNGPQVFFGNHQPLEKI